MDLSRYKDIQVDDTAYGELIKELSKVLGKSFFATFKAFEALEPHQVASILVDSEKWQDRKFKSRAMMIWWLRKQL